MLLVQILLLQWLCGYYYHSDGYFKDPIYNPFSDLPIHFNIQLQPTAQSKVTPKLPKNRDYESNYSELIGLPSHFQEQPQSNFQYSLEVTVNRSSGIPFALMSTHQLAYYFATLGYTREQILDHYHLYFSDAFIDLVKEFPEHEAALRKHCAKFLQCTFGKKLAEWLKGNYQSGLAKRLQTLCNRLPKQTSQEIAPAQQKASFKKSDLYLFAEWLKSKRLHQQYALESAQRFQNRIEAISDRTLVDGQLAIERLLLQETDDLIKIIETHTSPLIREQVGALRSCVTAAREFTQLKQFNTASTILDFCCSFTELAATLSVAAAKGFANAAINAHDHPEEVAIGLAVGIASSILPLHVVCAYHAICMISCCMPTIKDVIKIVRTAPHDPTQGLADFKTYLSPLTTFVEKIQTKEISLTQLAESTIMVAAETYAQQKMFGGFASLYGSMKDKAVAWVAKNPSLKFAHYLKTPEGMLFKSAQGIQDNSFKERVTQTLNRTEDFFEKTQFGKANEKYFQRTIYGYPPHRAFQAITNINDQIKKGYYIVLDGLHKNHLELYDKGKEWLKVINFDGTFNERLTIKAQQGKPRNPLKIMKG